MLPRRGPQVYFSGRRRLDLLLAELRCAVAVAGDNVSLGSKCLLLRGQARFTAEGRTTRLVYRHTSTSFFADTFGVWSKRVPRSHVDAIFGL